jgi:hypothetical protein
MSGYQRSSEKCHYPLSSPASLKIETSNVNSNMNQTIKDINIVTLPFVILLNDIADTNADLMHHDEFSCRNLSAYKTVLEGLREYLFDGNQYMLNHYFEARDTLKLLLEQAGGRIRVLLPASAGMTIKDDERISQAMHVSSQLAELLEFIHPKNLDAL